MLDSLCQTKWSDASVLVHSGHQIVFMWLTRSLFLCFFPPHPSPTTLILSAFCLSSILLPTAAAPTWEGRVGAASGAGAGVPGQQAHEENQKNGEWNHLKAADTGTGTLDPAGLLRNAPKKEKRNTIYFISPCKAWALDISVVCGLVRHVWASPYLSFSCSVDKMFLWLIPPLLVVSPHDHSYVHSCRSPHRLKSKWNSLPGVNDSVSLSGNVAFNQPTKQPVL